jgi:uncharacterized protein YdeI (BOF family)
MINAILMILAATTSGDPSAVTGRDTTMAVGATVSQSLRLSSSSLVAEDAVVTIADSADVEVSAVGATVARVGGDTIVTRDGAGPMVITIEY